MSKYVFEFRSDMTGELTAAACTQAIEQMKWGLKSTINAKIVAVTPRTFLGQEMTVTILLREHGNTCMVQVTGTVPIPVLGKPAPKYIRMLEEFQAVCQGAFVSVWQAASQPEEAPPEAIFQNSWNDWGKR